MASARQCGGKLVVGADPEAGVPGPDFTKHVGGNHHLRGSREVAVFTVQHHVVAADGEGGLLLTFCKRDKRSSFTVRCYDMMLDSKYSTSRLPRR